VFCVLIGDHKKELYPLIEWGVKRTLLEFAMYYGSRDAAAHPGHP
jgi:hypothetical protein